MKNNKNINKGTGLILGFLAFIVIVVASYGSLSEGQPLKNTEELVIAFFKRDLSCNSFATCFKNTKISASIFSSKLSDTLHTSAVFKMSGKKASMGGQAWKKISKQGVWIGGELSITNKLGFGKELLMGYELNYKEFQMFPYMALVLDEEKLASFGIKYYYKDALSLGLEFKNINYVEAEKDVPSLKDWAVSMSVGFPLSLKASKDLINMSKSE